MKMKENIRLEERKKYQKEKEQKKLQTAKVPCHARNDITQEEHGSLGSNNSRSPH